MRYMSGLDKGLSLLLVFYVILLLGGIGGYIQNIYKLTQCVFKEPYKAEVIRSVGLFPLVGAIVGWIDVGK